MKKELLMMFNLIKLENQEIISQLMRCRIFYHPTLQVIDFQISNYWKMIDLRSGNIILQKIPLVCAHLACFVDFFPSTLIWLDETILCVVILEDGVSIMFLYGLWYHSLFFSFFLPFFLINHQLIFRLSFGFCLQIHKQLIKFKFWFFFYVQKYFAAVKSCLDWQNSDGRIFPISDFSWDLSYKCNFS